MQANNSLYDIAVVGGGLAGLALAIQCARQGYTTILLEKEHYPFNRVCGEYISMESWNFLTRLGLPLQQMNLPNITQLLVTAPNGNKIEQELPLGGFGISRYKIDYELYLIAKAAGVTIQEGCKVIDINFNENQFTVTTTLGNVNATTAAGCFGKRSNIDVKWNRSFIRRLNNRLNNYVGIKYHIKTNWPDNLIALHNFKNGYCGISKIEDDKYCLCYLTTAKNLQQCDNSIVNLEEKVLKQNRHLKQILENSEKLFKTPVTISQISFNKKMQVENNVLLLGDAAGMITPLCGNGMSMALHGSKIAFEAINKFLSRQITRSQMEAVYAKNWQKEFADRLFTGRLIQRLFGKIWVTNFFIAAIKSFPFLIRILIKKTHGMPF
jgi:menaquinone-9 beta-reductase